MKNDKHTTAIPDAVVAQSLTKLNEVREMIAPCVVPLTPTDRHEIPKMGAKTLEFVENAYTLARANPGLVPGFLDMEVFEADFTDAHNLVELSTTARQVYEDISDTGMAAGSEAYQEALVFYNSVKVAASQNVDGAKAVYETLKTRFPGNKQKSGNNTETETE
jgi:hypothetical protein